MASVIAGACSSIFMKNCFQRGASSQTCRYTNIFHNHRTVTMHNIQLRTYYRISSSFNKNSLLIGPDNKKHFQSQRVVNYLVSSALVHQSFVRHNSTIGSVDAAAAIASSGTDTVLDTAATSGAEFLDFLGDTITAAAPIAEPTLRSLGLATSTPSGLVQAALESLHVSLDLPWWQAIVIGTICIRLAIFPLMILAQRNAAEMHNHLPTMTRLQERMMQARYHGDAAEVRKASDELTEYMFRNKVNPFKSMLVPLAQMPIFMSVFFGVNAMAKLPVASMQTGGCLWFTDLTVVDPYYVLPLLTAATLLATVEIGADGVKAGQMAPGMKYFIRAMPFIVFPVIMKFPAAMLCYWFTSNAISLIQVVFLKMPGVRPFFKIPPLVDHSLGAKLKDRNIPKKGFMESFQEAMANIRIANEIQERERLNSLHMKESQRKQMLTIKPKEPEKPK